MDNDTKLIQQADMLSATWETPSYFMNVVSIFSPEQRNMKLTQAAQIYVRLAKQATAGIKEIATYYNKAIYIFTLIKDYDAITMCYTNLLNEQLHREINVPILNATFNAIIYHFALIKHLEKKAIYIEKYANWLRDCPANNTNEWDINELYLQAANIYLYKNKINDYVRCLSIVATRPCPHIIYDIQYRAILFDIIGNYSSSLLAIRAYTSAIICHLSINHMVAAKLLLSRCIIRSREFALSDNRNFCEDLISIIENNDIVKITAICENTDRYLSQWDLQMCIKIEQYMCNTK